MRSINNKSMLEEVCLLARLLLLGAAVYIQEFAFSIDKNRKGEGEGER